ncbi:MAG: YkgJ family cysteine cluster protein [Opitutae bacterium]|nr:YkgJ family cysteine cluster protein [Opitutae bacterium]
MRDRRGGNRRNCFAGRAPARRDGGIVTVPADCLRCGVCCFSTLDTYVRVTGDDWTRLGAEAERVAHFIGHRAFMRMQDGHCAALQVRRCTDGAPELFCTIYDRRPQTCRDLARGSPECEGELLRKAGGIVT